MYSILLVLLLAPYCVRSTTCSVEEKFRLAGIVPELIPIAPAQQINVSYPSRNDVELGNELTPLQVKDQPNITWNSSDSELYTLSFSDPDAPSMNNPVFGPINHWLVVNIPGSNVSAGQVLTAYKGSQPRPNTGKHRYVFLVYKQTGSISPNATNYGENRRKFQIKDFAQLFELGTPIAGNFFYAQYDDYVATVM